MARHAYWVILVGTTPTAFRAAVRDTLVPTLRQLERTQPDVALRWFERGRIWESPEAARFGLKAGGPSHERRDRGWRPGGDHRDPRERWALTRDQKRARFKERARRPPRPDGPPDAAPPAPPTDPQPPGAPTPPRPHRPKGRDHRGPRPGGAGFDRRRDSPKGPPGSPRPSPRGSGASGAGARPPKGPHRPWGPPRSGSKPFRRGPQRPRGRGGPNRGGQGGGR